MGCCSGLVHIIMNETWVTHLNRDIILLFYHYVRLQVRKFTHTNAERIHERLSYLITTFRHDDGKSSLNVGQVNLLQMKYNFGLTPSTITTHDIMYIVELQVGTKVNQIHRFRIIECMVRESRRDNNLVTHAHNCIRLR